MPLADISRTFELMNKGESIRSVVTLQVRLQHNKRRHHPRRRMIRYSTATGSE
jgi:hypothetical protein